MYLTNLLEHGTTQVSGVHCYQAESLSKHEKITDKLILTCESQKCAEM